MEAPFKSAISELPPNGEVAIYGLGKYTKWHFDELKSLLDARGVRILGIIDDSFDVPSEYRGLPVMSMKTAAAEWRPGHLLLSTSIFEEEMEAEARRHMPEARLVRLHGPDKGLKQCDDSAFLSGLKATYHAARQYTMGLLTEADVSTMLSLLLPLCKANPRIRVLEIGAAGGFSTYWQASLVRRFSPEGLVYSLDYWEDYAVNLPPASQFHFPKYTDMAVFFLGNMKGFGLLPKVRPLKMPSEEGLSFLPPDFFDAAFIDGCHSYSGVKTDLDLVSKVVRKGGLLMGHDCTCDPRLVDEGFLRDNRDSRTSLKVPPEAWLEPRPQTLVHPGLLLALKERFGGSLKLHPGSSIWSGAVPKP